jgi:hypothetical protein
MKHEQQKAWLIAYFWSLQGRRPDPKLRQTKKAEDQREVLKVAHGRVQTDRGRPVTESTINSWAKDFARRGDDGLVNPRRHSNELRALSRSEAEAKVVLILKTLASAPVGS